MSHPNLSARRTEIARLQRYQIRFEPQVIEALAREFGCSVGTVRNDLRVVAADSAQRTRIDSIWRQQFGAL